MRDNAGQEGKKEDDEMLKSLIQLVKRRVINGGGVKFGPNGTVALLKQLRRVPVSAPVPEPEPRDDWYLVGEGDYLTIMSHKAKNFVTGPIRKEYAELIVKAVNGVLYGK